MDAICVGDFIQHLYGKCSTKCGNLDNSWQCFNLNSETCAIRMINIQLNEVSTKFLKSLINFNHFTRPKNEMKKTSLVKALKRCSAIHCKPRQQGIDLMIPVCLNENDFNCNYDTS